MDQLGIQLEQQWQQDLNQMIQNMEKQMRPIIKEMNDKYIKNYIIRYPKIDVVENNNEYIIKASLPGMNKKDIKINLVKDSENGGYVLTISGTKKIEDMLNKGNFKSKETYYGEFKRIIYITKPILVDKVKAEYKDGNLFITIPKDENSVEKSDSIINIPIK